MSAPPWVHRIGLYNHVELGPNCPPEEEVPTCTECPAYTDCEYAEKEHAP